MYGLKITHYNAIGKPVEDKKFYNKWTVDKICRQIRGLTGKEQYDLKVRGFVQAEYEGQLALFEIIQEDENAEKEMATKGENQAGTPELKAVTRGYDRIRGMERTDHFGDVHNGIEGVAEVRASGHATPYGSGGGPL